MHRSGLICIALLATRWLAAAEQPAFPDEQIAARVQQVLDQVMARPEAVALSVAVARNDGLLVERGLGIANLEADVPADARTMFRIGSITKQYTAAAIMKLVERGKLGLDDDLRKYVTAYDTGGRTVTIRQLLNHTSGVPSYTSQPAFFPEGSPRDLTHEQLLGFVKDVPFDFEPGAGWNYSNTGYYLLGMVVEAADGRPWARFMQEEFFTPLGLARTRHGSEREIIGNRAQGYGTDPATGQRVNDELISMNTPGAGGALIASAGDLVRWQIALVNDRVVEPASYRQMITPATGPDVEPYGFGLLVNEVDGRRRIWHDGGIPGFNSVLAFFPDLDLHVAVISSSETLPSDLVSSLIVRAVTTPGPIPEIRSTAHPDSEAALRRLIAEVTRGEPDYSRMSPQMATRTRQRLPTLQPMLAGHGAVESLTFVNTDIRGADTYDARFANGGTLQLSIALDAEGRTTMARVRPPSPPPRQTPVP